MRLLRGWFVTTIQRTGLGTVNRGRAQPVYFGRILVEFPVPVKNGINKNSNSNMKNNALDGDPGWTRTSDISLRRELHLML
jgi:hypothetical protein